MNLYLGSIKEFEFMYSIMHIGVDILGTNNGNSDITRITIDEPNRSKYPQHACHMFRIIKHRTRSIVEVKRNEERKEKEKETVQMVHQRFRTAVAKDNCLLYHRKFVPLRRVLVTSVAIVLRTSSLCSRECDLKNGTLKEEMPSLRNMMTTNTTDACETRDPCQHGGICISTDSGPICECRSGDYEGAYCEKGELFFLIFVERSFSASTIDFWVTPIGQREVEIVETWKVVLCERKCSRDYSVMLWVKYRDEDEMKKMIIQRYKCFLKTQRLQRRWIFCNSKEDISRDFFIFLMSEVKF
ncbi:hypothetical protein WN51_10905 [Melipona quadrifasciata]|uniref:EGF-like domain-containing protein n=1 Tax=Melipona quadrifasciata TaxID=166423 RepID=A0A0M9A792_9HYME|nr:hypothetical protein WN51_10905 [Melipona quadrifasciata]